MNNVTTDIINKLIEKQKENDVEVVSIGKIDGEIIAIEIKKSLSMDDIYQICSVLNISSFTNSDDDETVYVPFAEISAFKVALIKAYVPGIELPESITDAYKLCSDLDLFQILHNTMKNNSTYRDLQGVSNRYSEYHRLCNIGITSIIFFVKKAVSEVDIAALLSNFVSDFASNTNSDNSIEIDGAIDNIIPIS